MNMKAAWCYEVFVFYTTSPHGVRTQTNTTCYKLRLSRESAHSFSFLLSSLCPSPQLKIARVSQSVQKPGYGLNNRGSIPGRGNDGMCLRSGAHPASYSVSAGDSYPGGKSGRGVKVTFTSILVKRLLITGATSSWRVLS